MPNISQRHTGLDVIRCVALFSVVAVHFFLNTGFYEEIIDGPVMLFLLCLRSGLMISIPLFLMLSGYLLCNKTLTAAYYLRIIRILFIYVCTSLLYGLYRVYIFRDGMTLLDALLGIFSFSTLSYSWYIEMYCGLFLLIPFLNILYHGLETKKQKQWLIITLLLLTAAPSMVNIYRFDDWTWWVFPASNHTFHPLIPDWWTGIYPITYYVIGCYLREYPLKRKRSDHIALLFSFICLFGTFSYFRSRGGLFIWGPWQGWGSLFCVLISVLLFSLLLELDYTKLKKPIKKVFSAVSDLSLGAFLFSQLYDNLIYPVLNANVPVMMDRLPYFFVTVPLVLTLSLASSFVLNGLYRDTLAKLVSKLQAKIPN